MNESIWFIHKIVEAQCKKTMCHYCAYRLKVKPIYRMMRYENLRWEEGYLVVSCRFYQKKGNKICSPDAYFGLICSLPFACSKILPLNSSFINERSLPLIDDESFDRLDLPVFPHPRFSVLGEPHDGAMHLVTEVRAHECHPEDEFDHRKNAHSCEEAHGATWRRK